MANQSFSKVWIIIILVVLLWGGIFIYKSFGPSKEEIRVPGEEKTPKTIEEEIANWETYKNEEYGYEIKYPSILYLESGSEYVILRGLRERQTYRSINIDIHINSSQLPLKRWWDLYGWQPRNDVLIEETIFAGRPAIKVEAVVGAVDKRSNRGVLINLNGKVLLISADLSQTEDENDYFNKMLSTFRFF